MNSLEQNDGKISGGDMQLELHKQLCRDDMKVNLKRGFLEGAAVAGICTGIFVVMMWRTESAISSFSDLGLIACSTGLLGFMVGAFRAKSVTPRNDRPA